MYHTTKKCLIGLILLIYLVVNFNKGVFEVTHILNHLFTSGYSYHTHDIDSEIYDHEHFILNLDLFKIAFEQCSHSLTEQKKELQLSVNKTLQNFPSVVFKMNLGVLKDKNNSFFNLLLPPTPLLEIMTPPPDHGLTLIAC
ncbi:hypothetical protein KO500_16085 [Cellulophaga baltica]|uniref:hypothetical protein n=1 Tax=Cellulophaga TaxID=104264 RepID=UPI001C077F64|nr:MULTISPECIES: hypothetical protein [Cellulophaga]MBU2997962.1 hypothetical protein [Cellulophaga baltica]MDO6769363.1 hypothetical protein [Cellulophaga sp. 1_MG-2023]